jgi:hypothetical protein
MSATVRQNGFELGVLALAAVGGALGFATWGPMGAVGTALVVGVLVYLHFAYPF